MRISRMPAILLGITLLAALSAAAQDLPVATGPSSNLGFALPDPFSGVLTYAITGSENVRFGNFSSYVSSLSGDLGYNSVSNSKPTSVVYTGGYLYASARHNQNVPSSSSFHSLRLSQGFSARRWAFGLGDTLQYLPQAPTSGLSGIAGIGDVGLGLPVGGVAGQDILTNYGQRISNTTQGSAQRSLTGKTSFSASGSYSLQRFVDDSGGLPSDGFGGSGGLHRRIDALTSVGLSYSYSHYSYPGSNVSLSSQSVQAQYGRQMNRRLHISVAGGGFKSSSNIPSLGAGSWNVEAHASAQYAGHYSNFGATLDRGVQNGSGVVRGAVVTSATAVYNRKIGRAIGISADGGYTQSDSFRMATTPFTARTALAAVQARRALARNFSGFVSYSLQKQLLNGTVTNNNAFTGLNQTLGFGVTFAPRPIHLSGR